MKRKNVIPLFVAAVLLLFFAGSAWAGITVTLTSPQTTYTAGQNNTFTFNVGLVFTGDEWVDRYQFVFPAGVTVVSATPPSGAGNCGNNAGVQSICSSSSIVSWAKVGVPCSGAFSPTKCGAYRASESVFVIEVSVPADFTGPLTVTLNSLGDGWLLFEPSVDTDTVTFDNDQPVKSIPTTSTWGLVTLALLITGAAFISLRRRRTVTH